MGPLLPRLLLGLTWLGTFALLFGAQRQALAAHMPQWGQDLAFFTQLLDAAAAGRGFATPLLLEPTGLLQMVHFHPVLVGVIPLWWVAPGPGLLQALNVGTVLAAALPLAALGREAGRSAWFGLAAGLSWLVWTPVWCAALADFRPMELWAPALALVVWGVYSRRWGPLLGGAALCCAAREESAYVLTAAGLALLVLPLRGPARRQGLALLGVGLCWFGFLLLFKDNFFFHFDPRSPPVGEPPPPELRTARVRWLAQAWLGGYSLAPLSPTPLALVGGPLAWLWTDAQREWQLPTGPYVHLRVALLPALACAGVLGAAALARRWPRAGLPLGLGLVLGNAAALPADRVALWRRHQQVQERLGSAEHAAVEGLRRRVRPEDRVATDYGLIASLAPRAVLWNTAHLYLTEAAPPHWTGPWPLTLDAVDVVLAPEQDPVLAHLGGDWALEARGGGYGLWRRRAATAP